MKHWMLWLCWAVAAAVPGRAESLGFALEFAGGEKIAADDLRHVGLEGGAGERLAEGRGRFYVLRRWVHDPATSYARLVVTVTNTGAEPLAVTRIVLLDEPAAGFRGGGARVVGEFSGSPVVTAEYFTGVEHPLAENTVPAGRVRCALPLMQPLRPGESATASLVTGLYRPGQLRRDFLAYLERERARPYRPFLHHNTWYNLGYFTPFAEKDELALIDTLGRELVERRGVQLDGFVLDDGWDDTHSLWRFHAGWPAGLANMQAAAARHGAAPGIWLSPWGGYGKPKQARLAAAAGEGFEIRGGSFSLAGERYFARFSGLCAEVVRAGGVAYFKFDGIGSTEATGRIDPAAGRDFDAMLRLVAELRRLRPGLYVSQTTGTWPSPWWLRHVDNIWRDGDDHDFAGMGTARQQWITYRDAQTYANVVRRGPLFPLNSLMIHGIIYAAKAKRLADDPGDDFRSEVRSYFGTGTQLQELYLSPELLSPANWDDLAAAAKWARRHSEVLRDTHWIGGDPAKLEVYGWAAWSPQLGVVTLRNPSASAAEFALDVAAAFELPEGAAREFAVTGAYPDAPAPCAVTRAGGPVRIKLRPFEVLVLECRPRATTER